MEAEMGIAVLALAIAVGALVTAFAQAERLRKLLAGVRGERSVSLANLAKRVDELSRHSRAVSSDRAPTGDASASDVPATDALAVRVHELERRTREQAALLCSLINEDEARHLWNAAQEQPCLYELHGELEAELRSLVRRGLLKKTRDFRIHELEASFDFKAYFALTETGETLLSLRREQEQSDPRPADSLPPAMRESGVVEKELARQVG